MDTNMKPKESAEMMTLVDENPPTNKQLELVKQKQDDKKLTQRGQDKSSAQVHFATKTINYAKNPYKMPSDTDIFELREKERIAKKVERAEQRKLKAHEKTTYTQKIKNRTRTISKIEITDEEEDKLPAVEDDPTRTAAIIHDRKIGKETLNDYITKKREMFRVQYAIGVMHAEMKKLDEIAQAEERKLEMAEQYLEEDASTFDEFLKENDKNSVEAVKIAEQETKEKLEKVAEIKKINTTIMSLRSDISKSEDTLKEYKLYKNFLESISPKEWKEKLSKKRKERRIKKEQEKRTSSRPSSFKLRLMGKTPTKEESKMSTVVRKSTGTESIISSLDGFTSDSDEELELYFTEPQQVLDIFSELEEQNLSLIQNSQETEVVLEEVQQAFRENKLKMETESKLLQEQINKVKAKIMQEQEKSNELETKVKMFSSTGDALMEDQQALLTELKKKVEQVYRGIIGSNEANIDTLQMLNNIENRLEELFDLVESLPPDKVEAAKKAKEKERRLKMKEEKLKLLREHQEERIRKSLERAKAEPKKITGKKLMFRSEPPRMKKKQDKKLDHTTREEEELAYFFSV